MRQNYSTKRLKFFKQMDNVEDLKQLVSQSLQSSGVLGKFKVSTVMTTHRVQGSATS
jgi:hypothetical protein